MLIIVKKIIPAFLFKHVCRLPTKWKIISMVVLNLSTPFFYLFDIVKDCIQLSLLLSVVGGLWLFLENWLNFTSVVSVQIRVHPRFFNQVGHETIHVSSENKHLFTKSCHRQTYQNYEQPPRTSQNSDF